MMEAPVLPILAVQQPDARMLLSFATIIILALRTVAIHFRDALMSRSPAMITMPAPLMTVFPAVHTPPSSAMTEMPARMTAATRLPAVRLLRLSAMTGMSVLRTIAFLLRDAQQLQ